MRTGLSTDHSLTSTLHNHFANICWPFCRLWTVKLRQRGGGLLRMWAGSNWLWILGLDQRLAIIEKRLQTEWHVCVIRCRFFWAAPGGFNLWAFRLWTSNHSSSWAHTQIQQIRPPSSTGIINTPKCSIWLRQDGATKLWGIKYIFSWDHSGLHLWTMSSGY